MMCALTKIRWVVARASRFVLVSLVLMLMLRAAAAAAEPGDHPALDDAFRNLTALQLGGDLQAFRAIDQAVSAAGTDERLRADVESRLIGVLRGDATELAKDFACRHLATVGTDAAIDSLAVLLPDPRLAHMARYALEGIGGPAAARTLREMLAKTDGRLRIGAVVSLGRLADAESVAAVAELLDEENDEVREACLIALSRIGTVSAARAIQQFAAKAPPDHPALAQAQLAAAEALCQRGEYDQAAAICRAVLETRKPRVRAAAFRGLLAASPAERLDLILAALTGQDASDRAVAVDWLIDLGTPDEIAKVAATVPQMPAESRIEVFLALAGRDAAAIRSAALQTLDDHCPEVAVAAMSALIRCGTADDVPALIAMATGSADARVRDAAFETLRLMPAEGVVRAIGVWLEQTADPPAVMIRAALSRRAPELVPALVNAVESPRAETRVEAWKALEILAGGEHAGTLVHRLCETEPGEEREAADRAVWMSCQRVDDPTQRSAPLLAVLAAGDESAAVAVLPTLARIGEPRALPAVRKAMQSDSHAVRDAGHRALANWPDPAVADELLQIAKTSSVESYRIWSLRAYARLIALPSDRPAQQTFELLRDAMALAMRTEDKELFLSRLSAVRVPDSLTLLLSFDDDPTLRKAAVAAVFTLAKGLSQSHPELAAAALTRIQPLVEDPATIQQIPKVLRDIEKRQ
jgi:HEAT repeat protein